MNQETKTTWRLLDGDLRNIWISLWIEIKKDVPFFSSIGAIVGYFLLLHERLKESGLAKDKAWADALISDFLSLNAFSLIFFGLLSIGSVATLLSGFWRDSARLNAVVKHLEIRLSQIASSVIAFAIGISALALVQSFITITPSGMKLASIVLFLNVFLVVSHIASAAVARRVEPFDNRWVALISLVISVALISWIITQGYKPTC